MKLLGLETKTSQISDRSNPNTLLANDYSAIQCSSESEGVEGCLFTKDNLLVFVTEGTLKLRFGKTEYTIQKNHMAFIKKDILIEYATTCKRGSPTKLEYIIVFFKYDLVMEFIKLSQIRHTAYSDPASVTVDIVDEPLQRFINSLQSYFICSENAAALLTKIKLLELLYNLSNTNNHIWKQLINLRQPFHRDITATVQENVTTSLSLNELAALSGRSLSSFRRDFLAIYNMPPSQWIRQRRLEKARELLLNTAMTVTDVCYTLGFENLPHFSRLFKTHFGNSPSECKRLKLVA